jgi:hypothetical protein
MSEALYNAITARYNFVVPDEYRRLQSRGLLTMSAPAHASAFHRPGSYLWLNDMEWYSLQDIVDFKFQSYHMAGFVPFAFSAGGDYWCWHPKHADHRGAQVLCCPHDCELATIYAPNFQTALYRQALDFCRGSASEEDIDPAAFLRRWAADLAPIFPERWCAHLRRLAEDSERSAHASVLDQSEIAFDLFDAKLRWMQ